ncbi:alpha/beta hydrolase [Paraburkholderia sediminicola]|uniref:alpha/beta hydrolase n=1 Tax=Paraburkholderia sediminicola TaxID=458836 RepID=UPI0038BDCAB3
MQPDEVFIPVDRGVSVHAWVFRPSGFSGPRPAITMAHGFAGLKYRGLGAFAERFAAAGFVVVVHDHRNFGLSGGAVRGDIDPWQQISDWRRVISYVEAMDGVDATRIGLWGTSYAGGHALVLAATDSRIKAVVSQVPTISGYEQSMRRIAPADRPALNELYNEDERAQHRGALPMTQLLVSTDPNVRAAYRSQAVIDFHDQFQIPDGVDHGEVITLQSSRRAQMFDPGVWVSRIAPKPLLMIVGTRDETTPTDLALAAYEQAQEPKRLVMFEGGHYDAYLGAFEATSPAAVAWFFGHLNLAV